MILVMAVPINSDSTLFIIAKTEMYILKTKRIILWKKNHKLTLLISKNIHKLSNGKFTED